MGVNVVTHILYCCYNCIDLPYSCHCLGLKIQHQRLGVLEARVNYHKCTDKLCGGDRQL